MSEKLKIRPYARLITMLGDQLIRDETIALSELIKNAYDADATWVKISLNNFNNDFTTRAESSIVIEDNGNGMNKDILEKDWLNPATPVKLKNKQHDPLTQKGRYIQGEKGIGRFAVFKLGRVVRITTRRQAKDSSNRFIDRGELKEDTLYYDFARYDDDFLSEQGKDRELFLDDLQVEFSQTDPQVFKCQPLKLGIEKNLTTGTHGTRIEISRLRGTWSEYKFNKVFSQTSDLQPLLKVSKDTDFRIYFYINDKWHNNDSQNTNQKVLNLLANKAVFKVEEGIFHQANRSFSFKLNGVPTTLSFDDPEIQGLYLYKLLNPTIPKKACGDFKFDFFLFDFAGGPTQPPKYHLDREDKGLLKKHRVYLYRDDIRVMPYGSPEDDWLNVDVIRGTKRADTFLSNDQTVGWIFITQKDNPALKDKTNREGLIEGDGEFDTFKFNVQILLAWLRAKPYARYLASNRKKAENELSRGDRMDAFIERARIQADGDSEMMKFVNSFKQKYDREHSVFEQRIRKTENLAAVGLSVETASHDLMMLLRRSLEQLDGLIKDLMVHKDIDSAILQQSLESIRGQLGMVETQMGDIQLLFPSSKGRSKIVDVREIVDKVFNIYKRVLNRNSINVEYEVKGNPVRVRVTDAVLLQLFINLFDNALWWLQTTDSDRKILITFDGDDQRVIFSDNGPGVREEDAPYIFDAFFSGKGIEGRGLGLYIARQLLDRFGYSIELVSDLKDRRLKGANFVINFNQDLGQK